SRSLYPACRACRTRRTPPVRATEGIVFSRRSRAGRAVATAALLVWALALAAGGCAPQGRSGAGASADTAPSALPAAAEATREDSLAAREGAADESFATALVPLRDVQIVARVEGEVVAVDIEEGRRVQAGARLAQI